MIRQFISLAVTILFVIIYFTTITYAAAVKEGDRGEHVAEVQRILIAKGLLGGSADGICGSATVNAIKKFQAINGLVVDGICGDDTFNLMLETVDTTIDINNSGGDDSNYAIKYGMSGADVEELQNILIALGYMDGTADGVCGTTTVNAIKNFQASHGLTADGICGTATFDMINVDAEAYMAGDTSVKLNNQENKTEAAIGSVIKAGMRGDGVIRLQQKLISLGFLSGMADGVAGSKTVEAIKKFQLSQNLEADGIAGVVTLSRLYDNSSNFKPFAEIESFSNDDNSSTEIVSNGGYAEIGSVIKPGMHGEGVVDVQRKLIEHGFLSGNADGICGERTVAAIKKFQISVGLKADGVCGLQTYAALEDADYNISDTSWNDNIDKVPTLGKSIYVEATAYSPFDPGAGLYTARGNVVHRGIIAVDPHFIPLGTRVYIPGYGEAVADDTGGAIKGNRIDIAFDTYDEAMYFGRQYIEIFILED